MNEKLKNFVARKFQIKLEVAEQEIKQGLVLINDEPCLDPEYEIKPEAEEKITHAKRHIFSVSQLKKYMKCPYSYYLHYHEKLVSEKVFIGTILGTVFHKCIETGIGANELGKIKQLFEETLETYREQGIELSLPTKGKPHKHLTDKEWELHLINDAISEISNFLMVFPKNVEILEHEKEINFKLSDYPFVGYVDMIINDGDKKAIVDLKTTYSFNYFDPESYKLQLALYCYAMGIEKAYLFVFSRNDEIKMKIFSYNFTKEKQQEFVNLAKKICFAIENEIFWKKEAKWVFSWRDRRMALTDSWCDRVCGFKTHCFGEPPEKE